MSEGPAVPDDYFHKHVDLFLGEFCSGCECFPNLSQFAEVPSDGSSAAWNLYLVLSVEHMKKLGWRQVGEDDVYCPDCLAKMPDSLS
jgi:hypothetical protein